MNTSHRNNYYKQLTTTISFDLVSEKNLQKKSTKMMVARRNWLLRCSILINVAVLLYICSHVMIGGSNMTMGPSYIIQEEYSKSHLKSNQPILTQESTGVHFNDRLIAEVSEKLTQNVVASPQQQPQQQQLIVEQLKEIDLNQNNNIDDNRFEVPTEQNYAPQQKADGVSGVGSVVGGPPNYQDVILINQTYGDNLPTDGGLDLEARLK